MPIQQAKNIIHLSSFLKSNTIIWIASFVAFLGYMTPSLAQGNADFEANVVEGCVPLQVTFTDRSTGNPISWEWTFGEEGRPTSTLVNAGTVHTYLRAGVYTITMKANYANNTSSSTTKRSYIRVLARPILDFNPDIFTGCQPLLVSFQSSIDAGEGTLTNVSWIFGDGNSSVTENPTHVYSISGDMNVTLRATNSVGCTESTTKNQLISVTDTRIDFTASALTICEGSPNIITFTNTSSNIANLNYVWDFGDGSPIFTGTNAEHTYTQIGDYTVTLRIEGNNDCMATKQIKNSTSVNTNFEIINSGGVNEQCVNRNFSLSARAPNATAWRWNLGNGIVINSSDGFVIAFYNTPGRYPVTLDVTYQSGCTGTQTKDIIIRPDPTPDFSITGCSLSKGFVYTENPFRNVTTWRWQFGDNTSSNEKNPTHEYNSQDNYNVILTVADEIGCRGQISKSIGVSNAPRADFTPNTLDACNEGETLGGCAPHTINFEDRSTPAFPWQGAWTFGDGQESANQNPTHTFVNPGDYTVELLIRNELGCEGRITKTVKVTDNVPVADFTADKTSLCIGEEVTLTANSPNADTFCWFLDGSMPVYTKNNVLKHQFSFEGSLNVRLIAKNNGCAANEVVRVFNIAEPLMDFGINVNCNNPYEISIENNSVGADTWEWNFGDGSPINSQDEEPTHQYNELKSYNITLSGTNNASACTVETVKVVNIVELTADFSAELQSGCSRLTTKFTIDSQSANRVSWSFGDGARIFGNSEAAKNPIKTYDSPGIYNVLLEAFDINECSVRVLKTNYINVLDIIGNFRSDIQISRCTELDVLFTDLSRGTPPITSWLWDFGDGATSTEQNPMHTYTTPDKYNVTLTLSNPQGSCGTTQTGGINFTNPTPNFVSSKVGKHCIDEELTLFNTSQDASTYEWRIEYPNAIFDTPTSTHATVRHRESGLYDVQLTATDQYGCSITRLWEDAIDVSGIAADFTATQTSVSCPPLLTSFIENSNDDAIVSWLWDFGDGGRSNIEQPKYEYNTPGQYDVSLTISNNSGCSSSITKENFIFVDGPSGTFTSDKEKCEGEPFTFEASTTRTTKILWDFGDGSSVENVTETSHTYSSAGEYVPIISIEDNKGCLRLLLGRPVNVLPLPNVTSISLSENYPFTGEEITLSVSGDQIASAQWDIEDNKMEGIRINHAFSTTNYAVANVFIVNENGCSKSVSKEIFVQENIKFIPNVFTPNADDRNPTFQILNVNKGVWDLSIYNRYGKPVYITDAYDNQWKGENVISGVYYYMLKNRYRTTLYKGIIQIIKY